MRFILLLIIFNLSAMANVTPNNYSIKITDANHHLAQVTLVFRNVLTRTLVVKMPAWRTGKYKILDLAANVRNFQAFDVRNKALTWDKLDKNTWRMFVNTPGVVKITYQVYANQLSNRVSHIDATHAYLDASGVFMYSEKMRQQSITVDLKVAHEWQSVSGLEKTGKHQFKAANYDQLIDSPIETGIHESITFKVDEQTYEIVIWGKGNYDFERLKQDISKIHHQAKKLWGSFPFKRYVFMYHAGDNLRGATEHLNSTIIQTDRFGFSPDKKYHRLIGTTTHEFIHTWNVKSYRPAGISPYDYERENYSDLFWIAEGTTSYYDNLLPLRSEIYDTKKFLENLAKDIDGFTQKPGRLVMSLAQSSFDTWMANDRERSKNTTVSIYLKGSLVSWLLDKLIRENTNNNKSLDDLHHQLYKHYANKQSGYTSANVKEILQEITGADYSDFWHKYIEGVEEIDFDELLKFYGLKFKQPKDKDDNKLALGITTKEVNGLLKLTTVSHNDSAWKAGLSAGDLLVAIDGWQINKQNYDKILENLEQDKTYSLSYFHSGELKTTTITPQIAVVKREIIAIKNPTKKQKQHFKSWTHHSFKEAFKDDK